MKILKTLKINSERKNEREIKFFNIPILHYGCVRDADKEEKYFDLLPSKSFFKRELDKIIATFNNKHDTVFIYRIDALGEIYLLTQFLNEYIKKYNIENFAIITYKRVVKETFNLFFPDINCYLFEEYNISIFNCLFEKSCFEYRNIKFYVYPQTLSEVRFLYGQYYAKQNGKKIFPQYILDKYKLEKYENNNPVLDVQKENLIRYLKDLNLENFIFIVPEANSVIELPVSFWEKLVNKFKENNIDVYINSTSKKYNFYNQPKLSIKESMYLSSMARAIVSMRTGFVELLLTNSVPKYVIYTNRKRDPISSWRMKEIFSLKYYPKTNSSIIEYCIDGTNEDVIIENIFKEIIKDESISNN